jgi:hypothetical protein
MLREYNPGTTILVAEFPDDGYMYDHLAHHLLGAGRQRNCDSLTASPDWLKRVPGQQLRIVLEDVDMALKPFLIRGASH